MYNILHRIASKFVFPVVWLPEPVPVPREWAGYLGEPWR